MSVNGTLVEDKMSTLKGECLYEKKHVPCARLYIGSMYGGNKHGGNKREGNKHLEKPWREQAFRETIERTRF